MGSDRDRLSGFPMALVLAGIILLAVGFALVVRHAQDEAETQSDRVEGQGDPVSRPTDGSPVAFRRGIYSVNLRYGSLSTVARVDDLYDHGFRLSPDGKRVAFTEIYNQGAANPITVVSLEGGKKSLGPFYSIESFSWSDTSDALFVSALLDPDETWPPAQLYRVELADNTTTATDLQYAPLGIELEGFSQDRQRVLHAATVEEGVGSKRRRFDQVAISDLGNANVIPLAEGSSPAWSPDEQRVAFVREGDLYVINSDGEQETRLVDAAQPFIGSPQWLPDGSGIVFSYASPNPSSLYTIGTDGNDKQYLTEGSNPAWSPDGKKILYSARTGGWGDSDIYVMKSDGTGIRKVSEFHPTDPLGRPRCHGGRDWQWSPNGRYISVTQPESGDIAVVSVDRPQEARIVGHGCDPQWLPDGAQLIFGTADGLVIHDVDRRSTVDGVSLANAFGDTLSPDAESVAFYRDGDLYICSSDGSNERKLVELPHVGSDWDWRRELPVWSPDGSRIVVSWLPDDGDYFSHVIDVVDVDHGEFRRIDEGYHPVWSPDSRRIVYWKFDGAAEYGIYISAADGSTEPERFTDGANPAWSPDGTRIAFSR
jgi:Tol biopolymer transport system component